HAFKCRVICNETFIEKNYFYATTILTNAAIGEKIVKFFNTGNWFMKEPRAGMETAGADRPETGDTSIKSG
ncbi:MAG: hypothetical protein P1P89_23255, partial [Desulfobacterales bacterium]|nr:hypothetical protein [Desulfobacterales bacterium]